MKPSEKLLLENKYDRLKFAALETYKDLRVIEAERDRYKAALQKMVESSNNMGPGIYLSSQSCIKIAKEALNEIP